MFFVILSVNENLCLVVQVSSGGESEEDEASNSGDGIDDGGDDGGDDGSDDGSYDGTDDSGGRGIGRGGGGGRGVGHGVRAVGRGRVVVAVVAEVSTVGAAMQPSMLGGRRRPMLSRQS